MMDGMLSIGGLIGLDLVALVIADLEKYVFFR